MSLPSDLAQCAYCLRFCSSTPHPDGLKYCNADCQAKYRDWVLRIDQLPTQSHTNHTEDHT